MIEKLKHPIVVYKKIVGRTGGHRIATLIIPKGALVHYEKNFEAKAISYATWYPKTYWHMKFRASKAFNVDGDGFSFYTRAFRYTPGTMVIPWFPFCRQERVCAAGIHFFLTKEEAQAFRS